MWSGFRREDFLQSAQLEDVETSQAFSGYASNLGLHMSSPN